MDSDQRERIEKVLGAFELLKILVVDATASQHQLSAETVEELLNLMGDITLQLVALAKLLRTTRHHSEKMAIAHKWQLEIAVAELNRVQTLLLASQQTVQRLNEDLRREQFRRCIEEDERKTAQRKLREFTHKNYHLEYVDDIQECPSCGEQQMDRQTDKTCVCRYCLSEFICDETM